MVPIVRVSCFRRLMFNYIMVNWGKRINTLRTMSWRLRKATEMTELSLRSSSILQHLDSSHMLTVWNHHVIHVPLSKDRLDWPIDFSSHRSIFIVCGLDHTLPEGIPFLDGWPQGFQEGFLTVIWQIAARYILRNTQCRGNTRKCRPVSIYHLYLKYFRDFGTQTWDRETYFCSKSFRDLNVLLFRKCLQVGT